MLICACIPATETSAPEAFWWPCDETGLQLQPNSLICWASDAEHPVVTHMASLVKRPLNIVQHLLLALLLVLNLLLYVLCSVHSGQWLQSRC